MEYFLVEIAAKAYSYNEYSMRPHPMTYYVEHENDIRSVFDIISYQKGAYKIDATVLRFSYLSLYIYIYTLPLYV